MGPNRRNLRQILGDLFSKLMSPDSQVKVQQLEEVIKGFSPREREAVEYLRYNKNESLAAYAHRVRLEKREPTDSLQGIQAALESFVELLAGYSHLKTYTRSINRQSVKQQLKDEEQKALAETGDPDYNSSYLESLRKQLLGFDEIERKVKLIEGQLKIIEKFFEILRGQGALLRSGGSSKNFEAWLERDLPAVLSQIGVTKDRLKDDEPTSDLDSLGSPSKEVNRSLTKQAEIQGISPAQPQGQHHDLFLSHAFEDKDAIARPLYYALVAKGVSVWFDEAVLQLGDSLRRSIDQGLSKSRYGVVILSPKFLSKQWPQVELDGLVARETATGEKAILPIWHELDRDTLLRYSPTLADRLAGRSEDGIDALVIEILRVLKR